MILNDKSISISKKQLGIILVAFFSMIGIAYYLFRIKVDDKNESNKVPRNLSNGIFVLLIISYEIFAFQIISQEDNNHHLQLLNLLIGLSLIIVTLNQFVVDFRYFKIRILNAAIVLTLNLWIVYLMSFESLDLIFVIALLFNINSIPFKHCNKFAIGSILIYFVVNIFKGNIVYDTLNNDIFPNHLFVNLLIITLMYLSFVSLGKQIISNKSLEMTLEKLREQSLIMEKLAAQNERNRITAEIHDKVGHNLTTAIITLESALNNPLDTKEVTKKIKSTKLQIKTSLNEIRKSVRTISHNDEQSITDKIIDVFKLTKENTGIKINYIIDFNGDIIPLYQNTLLNITKESITNALKHGKSTELDFLIREENNQIFFTMSDNGKGIEVIKYGFGLKNIETIISKLNGFLTTSSKVNEGFTISVVIPYIRGESHE